MVAQTIINQIKALDKWALGAWGAREFIDRGNGVRFRVSGAKFKGFVLINYDEGADLYNIEFGQIVKLEWKLRGNVTGIYCDQLVDIIDARIEKGNSPMVIGE